tara:strand:- start:216 stop:494 length:279 start_codon:yes stop_codon:yes gene_type:complete
MKFLTSDSIIGSLCRELNLIQSRSELITLSIHNTDNENLKQRLNSEFTELKARVIDIKRLSKLITIGGEIDPLNIEFFNELLNRSLISMLVK